MTVAGDDLARVTVISPTRRIDLALPGGTTLGEIMPNIVRFSGYEGGSAAEVVHAWVLQRFGEDPLDPTRAIADLDIRDGETLHLRQLESAMPDAAFDDVVDAVATSTATQPNWTSRHSVIMALLVGAAILIGIPTLLLLRSPGLAASVSTLGLAFAAGLSAVLASRAFGKRTAAVALAWMSVVLAGLGGFFLLDQGLPIQVLTSAACVLLAAGVMGLGAQATPFAFLAAAIVAFVVIVVEIVSVIIPDQQIAVAAIAVTLIMGFTSLLPTASFRLARVAMPNLPSSAEQLVGDDTPVQSDIVVRAVMADKLLAAFLTASSITVALGTLLVLQHGSWFAVALAFCIGLALLLRARSFVGLEHRLPLLIGGVVIVLVTLGIAMVMIPSDVIRVLVGIGAAALLALILVIYAASFADRIVAPIWGRFGDVFEWLAIMAIVPLVLAVLNLYAFALGLAG
ncbi:type VII secretion integral membrane protein EccD [Propionibacteriaceae bacterium Y2011]|uniref:type VII secretion integral membrane protein EccD n=1 Tax=Microlunatus sp. Y2014 TaxID=3418488 RepID=UPI003B4AF65B